jgi:hypothetical protein
MGRNHVKVVVLRFAASLRLNTVANSRSLKDAVDSISIWSSYSRDAREPTNAKRTRKSKCSHCGKQSL